MSWLQDMFVGAVCSGDGLTQSIQENKVGFIFENRTIYQVRSKALVLLQAERFLTRFDTRLNPSNIIFLLSKASENLINEAQFLIARFPPPIVNWVIEFLNRGDKIS